VLIDLQVCRFFCSDQACAKTTFAEQVPGLTMSPTGGTCGTTWPKPSNVPSAGTDPACKNRHQTPNLGRQRRAA
jgi:hypothetical protein